ncbi:MarR family winged helix-turn-helix transcriptional regulator [Moraxella equi]|uniref:MarR family n=1 Tax=Moraxella equi TaxID=60442 RepID=A0A378QSW7_9GAMM|nr:helix-turn-helix domain-containing protein [Moraxella equi]OPH40000.1 MarR family transcriptional regulator [Moraxella equi]STZ03868.1 MarR family [Moraxella equi]
MPNTQLSRLAELTASLDSTFESYAKTQTVLLSELFVLYSFYYKKSLTQKDICDEWALPKQTVHTICKTLLEQNYLQSFDNPNDKRAKLLSLTQSGENYAKSIIAPLLEVENNTAQSFGIERLEKLIQEFAELEQIFKTKMSETINEPQ